MTVFIDTNVVLYASGVNDSEAKYRVARDILRMDTCVLSVQVLNEFVVQATKPSRPNRMTIDQALGFVSVLRRFDIVAIDIRLFDLAAQVQRRTTYSWWDSLIVAAAITAGCDTLLTEDLQHGRVVDGVRIENPFRDLA